MNHREACGKAFIPEPGHARFCAQPAGHTTGDEPTTHLVIFRGRALRYAVTTPERNS